MCTTRPILDKDGNPTGRFYKRNSVHPHIQRAWFINQMQEGHAARALDDARTQEIFLDFLIGHKGPYDYTYLRGMLTNRKLLRAYKQAEKKLAVLHIKE